MSSARAATDRMLHGLRRRLLLSRLRRRAMPSSVLFVCTGNLNRSPYAAAAFLRELEASEIRDVQVRSAGFAGSGRCSPAAALRVAHAHGIELEGHESRLVDLLELQAAGLVAAMDAAQYRKLKSMCGSGSSRLILLGDLDPLPIRSRDIADPQLDPDRYGEVFARIDRCVRQLALALLS